MKYLELKFWSYYVTTWFKILVYISDYLFHLPRWFQILCSKNLHSYNSRWRQCGSLFLNALYKDRLGLKKKLYSLVDLMSHIKVYDTTFVAIAFEAWTFFVILLYLYDKKIHASKAIAKKEELYTLICDVRSRLYSFFETYLVFEEGI